MSERKSLHEKQATPRIQEVSTERDHLEDLLAACRQKLEREPGDTALHEQCVRLLIALEHWEEAWGAIEQLRKLGQDESALPLELAAQLGRAGRRECLGLYEHLQARYPEDSQVLADRASACLHFGELEAAHAVLRLALEREPGALRLLDLAGRAEGSAGRPMAALAFAEQAAAKPEAPTAYLANLAARQRDCGEVEAAQASLCKALEREPEATGLIANALMLEQYGEATPEQRRASNEQLAANIRPALPLTDIPKAKRQRPLRVGLLSADLFTHSVAYFLEPLLEHHDPETLELIVISFGRWRDETTNRLKGYVSQWLEAATLDDSELAEQLRALEADLLIDLGGYTAGARPALLASRLALSQASYLGYPGSSGLPTVDLRITDAQVDPPALAEREFSEKLLRLDGPAHCYRPPAEPPPVEAGPHARGEPFTFGCFNALPKLHDRLLGYWAAILELCPESRLLLKARGLDETALAEHFRKRCAAIGLDTSRLELVGAQAGWEEHLRTYARVDLALDTYPYSGTTTTCEALLMGVPVLTQRGPCHAGRVSAGLLEHLGRTELICESGEAYVGQTLALSQTLESTREARQSLREALQQSSLMDGPAFARRFETALLAELLR